MTVSKQQLAASMRKIATALREEVDQHRQAHVEKCAQVLLAARGLSTLRQLMKGVPDGPR